MNASDDEFEQHLNELNDIVGTLVLWITPPDYLDPSINEVSWLSCMDSRVTIQPRQKCIHPAYYILFPPPDSILNHHLSPNSHHFGLHISADRRILSSALRFIINKLALTSAPAGYSHFKYSFLLDNEQSLEIWDKL